MPQTTTTCMTLSIDTYCCQSNTELYLIQDLFMLFIPAQSMCFCLHRISRWCWIYIFIQLNPYRFTQCAHGPPLPNSLLPTDHESPDPHWHIIHISPWTTPLLKENNYTWRTLPHSTINTSLAASDRNMQWKLLQAALQTNIDKIQPSLILVDWVFCTYF